MRFLVLSRQLFKNSAYYMVASFLPTAVGFIMLPIYTRYLTPTDYGVVALVLSLQSFLPLVMTLQIPSSISRFYFDYQSDRDEIKVFLSTILIFTSVLSIVVCIVISYNLPHIISFVFPQTKGYNDIFLLGVFSSFFSAISTVFASIIKVQQKARMFMRVSILIFFASFAINILEVIVFKRGAYGVVEGSLFSSVITSFAYFFVVKDLIVMRFKADLVLEPMKFSVPLIPHALSGLVFMYSDRIILERHVALSAIGVYMFSDKISMVFKQLVNGFNSAFSPYFNHASSLSKPNAVMEAKYISSVFVYLISMMVVTVSLFSTEIMFLFFNENYFRAWKMVPILSLAYVFRSLYCFSSSGLFYEKRTGRVALITGLAAVINIIINLALIPEYGVMIAVYSTVISFFVSYLLAECLSYNVYNLKILNVKIFILLIYLVSTVVISIQLNKNFQTFDYVDYIYKFSLLAIGVFIGFKCDLLNFSIFKRVKA